MLMCVTLAFESRIHEGFQIAFYGHTRVDLAPSSRARDCWTRVCLCVCVYVSKFGGVSSQSAIIIAAHLFSVYW